MVAAPISVWTVSAVDTSRGCDKECTFCSQQKYWGRKWRARSPEDIVREMLELRDKFGVNVVLFTDDYPTPDRKRWERLLDLLLPAYVEEGDEGFPADDQGQRGDEIGVCLPTHARAAGLDRPLDPPDPAMPSSGLARGGAANRAQPDNQP